jgi:heat shock protein HtpX
MWEQIQANRRRAAILISLMAVVLVLIGYVGGILIAGPDGGWFGVIAALAIWSVQMLVYASGAQSFLLQGANARELSREDSPRLFNVVDEMVIASGLGFTPKVYLIDDPAPNAFAMGRDPKNSVVAVTTGLLHRLNRDELQGVIAHEIGHLKNQDVKFMTLAAVMLGTIVILSEMIWRSMRYGGRARSRSNSRGGGQAQIIILVIALLLAILGPLMAQLLYFACSRKREYLADASGAQFTRYPEGLASALEKIASSAVQPAFASKVTAPMFIVNPLAAHNGEAVSLLSTHPPTTERVRILRGMAGAGLAFYEEAFRRAKGGALIGARSLQSAPQESIRAPSNEGPVESRHAVRDTVYRTHGYVNVQCDCGMQMRVPETYERNTVRCVRCSRELPLPAATAAPQQGTTPRVIPPPVSALQYTRAASGWESFRCACGRTLQLSPNFAAPFVTCPSCRRRIEVTRGVAA